MPGIGICLANLELKKQKFVSAGRKGLVEWANKTMTISRSQYCPLDTGLLRSTAQVTIIRNTLTEFFVRLSYATPYAVYVHEIPANHPWGSMKYLSTPFNLQSVYLLRKLESELRSAL
jgi:hypothetical protein